MPVHQVYLDKSFSGKMFVSMDIKKRESLLPGNKEKSL